MSTFTATIVNHVAIDIAAAPDAVWRAIIHEYVGASKFGEQYAIEPIDDPIAVLGGYRMRLEKDGAVVDERVVHFTEHDDTERRLSLFADYLSVPDGLQVFATYQAHETRGGVRYTIDCHTRTSIEAPATGAREDIIAAVAKMKGHFDTALTQYLESTKASLECT